MAVSKFLILVLIFAFLIKMYFSAKVSERFKRLPDHTFAFGLACVSVCSRSLSLSLYLPH